MTFCDIKLNLKSSVNDIYFKNSCFSDVFYKISLIIPIFNAEKFLDNTIQSIIKQTIGFENIELILVDDCSTDSSREIIQKYASDYDNIKPIFLAENSGAASYPRNKGIDEITGEYVMFLDADDEIFDDYCETLYNSIVKNDVDIVNCNHSSKLNNKIYINKSIKSINGKETLIESSEKLSLKHTAWGNIYKASLLKDNQIKFPNTMYDDGVFSINCLLKTEKPVIKLNNYPGYIYLIENEDSITHKASLKTLKGFIDGFELCKKLVKENNYEFSQKELIRSFVSMAIFILIKLDDLDIGIKELYTFENSLDFEIVLDSKPLNLINKKIMNQNFFQAKILIKLMGLFYNNKKIRNYIFINYSNLKELEV